MTDSSSHDGAAHADTAASSEDRLNRRHLLALVPSVGAVALATQATAAPGDTELAPNVMELPTTLALRDQRLLPAVRRVITRGYATPGDGGGAAWARVPKPPAHGVYLQDASGGVFEIDEGILRPEMFGARGGDVDDLAAIQQAVTVAAKTGRRVSFTQQRYSLGGTIIVPGKVGLFALTGAPFTELVQLRDDTTTILFAGENTRYWLISGFNFRWRRDQTARHRNSYAVRFEAEVPSGSGHWNFEIRDCLVSNGFRGFGQSDDGDKKPTCPIWGATFRSIGGGLNMAGAIIFLRTWGRIGQPNNRIDHFYARCDNMSDPAIVIDSTDTTVLTSVEFNRGKGCQLSIENSSNAMVEGIRFEEVQLGPKDAFIQASGGQTNLRVSGLSVQSIVLSDEVPPQGRDNAICRVSNGARLELVGFTDMPWRAPSAKRDQTMSSSLAVIDARRGSATAGFIAPLHDPALTLAKPDAAGRIALLNTDSYDFSLLTGSTAGLAPQLVRQRGQIVALTIFGDGAFEQSMGGLKLLRNGEMILDGQADLVPGTPAKGHFILKDALRREAGRLLVMPGDVLTLAVPSAAANTPAGGTLLLSVTAIRG